MSEFKTHWRPLLSSFVGIASALSANNFILSTFAPYLLGEFHWTRSQWALTGMSVILMVACIPVAGWLADRYGVRRVASVGVIGYPLCCVGYALMNGDIRLYLAIAVIQIILGSTTTATIYSRQVAEAFERWRGLALALCAGGPALVGAVGSPLITLFVHDYGWRWGFVVVAACSTACGVLALALAGPHAGGRPYAGERPAGDVAKPPISGVYRQIFAAPTFWLLFVATFLVSLPHTIAMTQLKVLMMEQGVNDVTAAWLIAVFAGGMTAGRILSGVALDFLPAHVVAAVFMACPGIGMLILASNLDTLPALFAAVVLIALSFGGEGDVVAFLAVRFFGIRIYSTVLGLLTAAMAAASALGAAVLGVLLGLTNSFVPYLLIASAGVFVGSMLFYSLGKRGRVSFMRSESADLGQRCVEA